MNSAPSSSSSSSSTTDAAPLPSTHTTQNTGTPLTPNPNITTSTSTTITNTNTSALAMLDSLTTPEQQLRYKTFVTSAVNPEIVSYLIDHMLPPMLLEEEKESIHCVLATACKTFAVQLCETAVALRNEEEEQKKQQQHLGGGGAEGGGDGTAANQTPPSQPLAAGYIVEAYRRILLQGKIPTVPKHNCG